MADADVVITGTVLTVDEARPTAEALAVAEVRATFLAGRQVYAQ
jgi:predicted amidohydrolase YtcJ